MHNFQGFERESQMSGYLMEPITDNEDFKGAVRNIKKGQTGIKMATWVIFKGNGLLDAFSVKILERFILVWTSHMSGYLLESIRDNENFKGAVFIASDWFHKVP